MRALPVAILIGFLGGTPLPSPTAAPPEPFATRSVSVFVDAQGRPNADAREALALLEDAAADGLDPADYRMPAFDEAASFEAALTGNLLAYLTDLHYGRVSPRSQGFRLDKKQALDLPALLQAGLAAHRLTQTADELRPRLAIYRGLRAALKRYRALADDRSLDAVPPAAAKSIHPGERYDGIHDLRRRLIALGDAPAQLPVDPAGVYDGPIVDGVKVFQARHGLLPDGVLGKRTLEELRVPIAVRVRQIELAMERVRWLPAAGARLIIVSIPMYRLWGWDGDASTAAPSIEMNVIVGKKGDTETPVFAAPLRFVVFNPYWNAPASIVKKEILPALHHDPQYLVKQDMEIVSGDSDEAAIVEATPEALDAVAAGRLRIRQRPGPKNSLGFVKFGFPNDDGVYMHGTPAPQLFGIARRDLSHGCVRLQEPLKFAEWVLSDQPDWTLPPIATANREEKPARVNLVTPIQVVLYYLTAMTTTEDGIVQFAADVYGHDAALARALASPSRGR